MRVRSGKPVLVGTDLTRALSLERIDPADLQVGEEWIQKLVCTQPEVLPILEIDPSYAPPILVGREVPTSAGPIDALFISPTGDLTIVEAKLWRNPQARREVVGQIIDYATSLAEWGYEELDAVISGTTGTGLWQTIQATGWSPFDNESVFVDKVLHSISQGDFLLLIVGDGIRSGVERMSSYVQAAPQLRFTLGLVELQIFEMAPDRRLVIPSVVMRTEEVTRAVVEVSVDQQAAVSVNVAVPADDSTASRTRLSKSRLLEELAEKASPEHVDFVNQIIDDFQATPGFRIHWASASFVIKYDSPTDGTRLTILVLTREGLAYVGWLYEQLERSGLDPRLGSEFAQELGAIVGQSMHHKYPDTWASPVPFDTIATNYDEIRSCILRFIQTLEESAVSSSSV